jgi:hypothetical protein
MPFELTESEFGAENEFGFLVGSGSIKVALALPNSQYRLHAFSFLDG